MITSPQNPKLKLARALAGRPKERRANQAFLVEGARLLQDALIAKQAFRFVLAAEALSAYAEKTLTDLERAGVSVERVSADLFASLSETATSQGLLGVLEISARPLPEPLDFIVLLDQIRDPGNLGALLRAAAAAGAQAVFLPPETTDPYSPKAVRAGMGAQFRLAMFSFGWEQIRLETSGLNIYLAETESAIPCWQADFRRPLALIIGGEAEGASPQARQLAGQNVVIPMPGGMESLNAATAGAILIFEVVRQRLETAP